MKYLSSIGGLQIINSTTSTIYEGTLAVNSNHDVMNIATSCTFNPNPVYGAACTNDNAGIWCLGGRNSTGFISSQLIYLNLSDHHGVLDSELCWQKFNVDNNTEVSFEGTLARSKNDPNRFIVYGKY